MTRKERLVAKKQPAVHRQLVSDETIDRLSHQAEDGYDVETLRRAGGRRLMGSTAARVVPVRLDPELDEALRQRVESEHSTASAVIRDALRSWLESA